jgi:glycosyltransferase involved in cell wall biosynthesis
MKIGYVMQEPRLAVVVPVYNEARSIMRLLQGLYGQKPRVKGVHYFVVDNASTDDTRQLIVEFLKSHKDFPLTIIEESQKGTGAASDTGFRTAIAKGYTVIARTDGDSVPLPDWTSRIISSFQRKNPPHLLGGQPMALKDEYYRPMDEWLMPISSTLTRWGFALIKLRPKYWKQARGYNMATSADAYLAVGGFPRTAIDELDEDVVYSVKVLKKFGAKSVLIDKKLLVQNSSRRIHTLGLVGVLIYYIFPSVRRAGNVDIR